MFLVLLRCSFDEIPLRIFGDRPSAVAYAETVSGEVSQDVQAIIDVDASAVIAVAIPGFKATGELETFEVVRTFDD